MIIVWKKGHPEKMYRQNEYGIFNEKSCTWINNFTIGHGRTFLFFLFLTDLLRLSNIEMLLTNK